MPRGELEPPAFEFATQFTADHDLVRLAPGSAHRSVPVWRGLNPNRYPIPHQLWLPDAGLLDMADCQTLPTPLFAGGAERPDELWLALPNSCDNGCGPIPTVELIRADVRAGTVRPRVCELRGGEKPALFALHDNRRVAAALFLQSLEVFGFGGADAGFDWSASGPSRNVQWMAFLPFDDSLITREAQPDGGAAFFRTVVLDGGLETAPSSLTDPFDTIYNFQPSPSGALAVGVPRSGTFDGGSFWRVAELEPGGTVTRTWLVPWLGGIEPEVLSGPDGNLVFAEGPSDGGTTIYGLRLP